MLVVVLSCTHLQKNMYVSMLFLYLVLTFDPTGKGFISAHYVNTHLPEDAEDVPCTVAVAGGG